MFKNWRAASYTVALMFLTLQITTNFVGLLIHQTSQKQFDQPYYTLTLTVDGPSLSPDTHVIGIEAPGPATAALELFRSSEKNRNPYDFKTFLRIEMPCGQSYEVKTMDDMPKRSVRCTCGNPLHWFIRYTKEDAQ